MFILFSLLVAFALQQFQTGYYITPVKPDTRMRDLGAVGITAYHAENGALVGVCTPAQISGYVVWLNPQRNPMYWIEYPPLVTMVEIDRLPTIDCKIVT